MGSRIVHVEVTGKNAGQLQRFYSEVFGWRLDTDNPGGYGMLRSDDQEVTAGIGGTPDGSGGQATFYVHAEDPAAVLAHVTSLGGRVVMPLTEVAPGTTIALFSDPEGHVVGLM